jgi:hypothetical protein
MSWFGSPLVGMLESKENSLELAFEIFVSGKVIIWVQNVLLALLCIVDFSQFLKDMQEKQEMT